MPDVETWRSRASWLPPAPLHANELWGQRARYLLRRVDLGLGFAAGESADELLQVSELFKESGLHDGLAQLQVEGAAGQDERRVVVEALQDVACRETQASYITHLSKSL